VLYYSEERSMDSVLTPIAEDVARKRYYHKDDQGNPKENWEGLSRRVVNHVCRNEDEEFKDQIFDLIYHTKFLPNSPCLVNSGREGKSQGLLACFVTKSPEDSWVGMVENIANFGHIARQGGGCGVSFSKIRPEGDPVFGSTHARACGPIEHMRMVSEVMSSITQSGFRGMACMGTLDVSHPDVMKFIVCKQRDRALKTFLKEDIFNHYDKYRKNISEQLSVVLDKFIYNFNISIVVNNAFMKAVEKDGDWDLRFNGKVYQTMKARDIFHAIVQNAWRNGDPGLLFWDAMNRGPYRFSEQCLNATNPCVTGDTVVITRDGPKAIKSIVGKPQEVLSLDEDWNRIWVKTKGAFLTKRNAKVITIHTQNSKITCTPDHKIHVHRGKEHGFVEGKDIHVGELILCNPCGLGVSYGLEHTSGEKWQGLRAEIQRLSKNPPQRGVTDTPVVSRWVRVKKDMSDDLNFRLDLHAFEAIFSQRGLVAEGQKRSHIEDSRNAVTKCARKEEPILSLDIESQSGTADKEIQLRLVSITDCGTSLFAEFLRVDNGDVLRFSTRELEARGAGLHTAQWRDVQARLLHILQGWKTVQNNRGEEQIYNGASRLQSRNATGNTDNRCRTHMRYIAICPEAFEFYREVPVSLERVVRITEEEEEQDVFDLTTDHSSHNFIANGLVVHNCGEQVLPEYGSCNLGSIDVSKFCDADIDDMDWKALRKAIHLAIQFLDDVIDANVFPTPEFAQWARNNRPVGLGIMGFADLLLKKHLAYGSPESLQFAEKLAEFFAKQAHIKSVELGRKRGTPPACAYDELEHRRNVTTLSIAPTGTIAQLAGCSHAIEPLYSETVYRYDNTGEKQYGTHEKANRPYFRCALSTVSPERQVTWQQHIDMQAAFQKHCDSAISKTINMPNDATPEDIASAYVRAWRAGCKGITIYRDGSKTTQVLMTDTKETDSRPKSVPCQIYKTTAEGFDWHVIIGVVNSRPYELFAVNGRVDLPKTGYVVKRKRRHYSLLDEEGNTLIDNLSEEEDHIHPRVSLETRRFSLELRNGIDPAEIVEQIDKSHETIASFSKAASRVLKKSGLVKCCAKDDDVCPDCAKLGKEVKLIPSAGCYECPECTYGRCG
jgi:ribonucleoside-diphosphate reductase alpha chain